MEELNPYYIRQRRKSIRDAYYYFILVKWLILAGSLYWLYTSISKLWEALR